MALRDKYKFDVSISEQWHYVDEKEPENFDACLAVAYDEVSEEYWVFSGLYDEDKKEFHDGCGFLKLKDTVAWLSITDSVSVNTLLE